MTRVTRVAIMLATSFRLVGVTAVHQVGDRLHPDLPALLLALGLEKLQDGEEQDDEQSCEAAGAALHRIDRAGRDLAGLLGDSHSLVTTWPLTVTRTEPVVTIVTSAGSGSGVGPGAGTSAGESHFSRFSVEPFHWLPSTGAEMPSASAWSVYCHSDHASQVPFGHSGSELYCASHRLVVSL